MGILGAQNPVNKYEASSIVKGAEPYLFVDLSGPGDKIVGVAYRKALTMVIGERTAGTYCVSSQLVYSEAKDREGAIKFAQTLMNEVNACTNGMPSPWREEIVRLGVTQPSSRFVGNYH